MARCATRRGRRARRRHRGFRRVQPTATPVSRESGGTTAPRRCSGHRRGPAGSSSPPRRWPNSFFWRAPRALAAPCRRSRGPADIRATRRSTSTRVTRETSGWSAFSRDTVRRRRKPQRARNRFGIETGNQMIAGGNDKPAAACGHGGVKSPWLVGALLTFVILLASRPALRAQAGAGTDNWVGTWATAVVARPPQGATFFGQTEKAPLNFNNQTLRQIVRTSVGGDRLRV